MITENLLLRTCSSFLILILFLKTCDANRQTNPHQCLSSSACGFIGNISFPFRLKDDPKHCGYPDFELACENNVTFVYLNSQKFQVTEINYPLQTIRLIDSSININNTCSFPKYSIYDTLDNSPYHSRVFPYPEEDCPIYIISCPYPLTNSSMFTEATDCANGDNFPFSGGRHSYIKVGLMSPSEVKEMCRVDLTLITLRRFKDVKNVSLSEIHQSLLYGFEISWSERYGGSCFGKSIVSFEPISSACFDGLRAKIYEVWENIRYPFDGRSSGPYAGILLIVLIILVVLFAGVSFPAKIIIGFACLLGFYHAVTRGSTSWPLIHFRIIIGLFFAVRFIIVFPCVIWILIYKFRRRHLSMFESIEAFLQSDNKLVPIRYSYSDIKMMTRGFRDKLGQGGYGSVYKGKLRSGHAVAVKLLGKPGGSGEDFINEIATIGRIHHVNVVKLVGYCAERSKRALVFDFMPNGSLEKYIFGREKMNSLNWDSKYEIAVGVARGIEYLHKGCDIQILHFDIKPHNILLDDKFIPKISDFGMAKYFGTDKDTVTLTAARGTIGYVAPELINRGFGRVSYKADVYSFGMLLMELVGLNRELTGNSDNSCHYFPYWIYDCFHQGKEIVFGNADENNALEYDDDSTRKIARKMTIVALWCIQMSPDNRPSMNKVLEMLQGEVERLQIPPQPSHSTQVALNEDQTWSTFSTDSAYLLSHDSAQEVVITLQE